MKYVLDSNVAIKWVLPEADSDKALQVLDESQQLIHELIAPNVFPIEVSHLSHPHFDPTSMVAHRIIRNNCSGG